MARLGKKRPHIGDVVEIKTSKGLANAQYTHEHTEPPRYGSLLRVLPGIHAVRPDSFTDLVGETEQFVVFFPLVAAVKGAIVEIVGHEEVPEWAVPFPVFRNGLPDREGKIHEWWLWDGQKQWKVGNLTSEMRSFPQEEVVNDTRLIEMIETGYRAEDDV
jgi:hypothetical protein